MRKEKSERRASGFPRRSYSKKELAALYFPLTSYNAAVRHLMDWVNNCPALRSRLDELGYVTKMRLLTPAQVGAIFDFLGEPEDENGY